VVLSFLAVVNRLRTGSPAPDRLTTCDGEHREFANRSVFHQRTFDWLDKTLLPRKAEMMVDSLYE
jgi:hypothetical protein